MTWFFAVLIVLLIGAVAVVASGRGSTLGTAYDDRADVRLPAEGPVTGDDVRDLQLNTAVRGYRASEVDALLERLAAQLDEQSEETAEEERFPRRDIPPAPGAPGAD